MKRNGFTLIELLAIIVILAIIAIIITPMIASTINSVKASSLKESVNSIAHASEQYCVNKNATDRHFDAQSYEINKDNANLIGFTYNKSLSGIISIYSDCSVAVKATDGTYYASKDANSDTIAYGLKPSDFDPTTIMVSTTIYWGVSQNYTLTISSKGLTAAESAKTGGSFKASDALSDPFGSTTSNAINPSIVNVVIKDLIAPYSTNKWFYNMSHLVSISGMENLNTSKVTDMNHMFYYCSSLTSLDVSHFNTSKVTDMRYMFNGCTALTTLDVSSFNTSNVTNMHSMFDGCTSLTSLDLSHFDTSKVTDMGFMFCDCSSLTSLNVSNFNTSKVTDMRYMFCNCSKITSLDVSHFDTSKVTNMSYMFYYCSKLTSLDTSKFVINAGTNTTNMYNNCPAHQ